jgi:hypothetical protein
MIVLRLLRELDVRLPTAAGRGAYLSAASGLVHHGTHLYVVADDEHHLGVFPSTGTAPGEWIELLPGVLPGQHRERKAAKADLESLVQLPAFPDFPSGALLAIGSGSRANRAQAVLLRLNAQGDVQLPISRVDLSSLYATLAEKIPGLNIEGAVVVGDELWLLQRGGKNGTANACVVLHLDRVFESLCASRRLDASALSKVLPLDLGNIEGVPLGFTDGCALPDGRVAFCAVAEDTANAYDDGPCAGSAIGLLDGSANLLRIDAIASRDKVEGITAQRMGEVIQVLLVTDDDDETIPGRLLAGEIPA